MFGKHLARVHALRISRREMAPCPTFDTDILHSYLCDTWLLGGEFEEINQHIWYIQHNNPPLAHYLLSPFSLQLAKEIDDFGAQNCKCMLCCHECLHVHEVCAFLGQYRTRLRGQPLWSSRKSHNWLDFCTDPLRHGLHWHRLQCHTVRTL